MRRRRDIAMFSLSFLDVVSCGFGAIILLLVIAQLAEPRVQQEQGRDLAAQEAELTEEIGALRQRARESDRLLASERRRLVALQEKRDAAVRHLAEVESVLAGTGTEARALTVVADRLEAARQQLTEEMRRLQARQASPRLDTRIGGVPVDSEYVIFVIDTSGSMQKHAWPLVRKMMAEILDIYPEVKGVQVMNDMGEYMFSQYAGRWIPDTPARRKAILRRLATWAPFSNSSPVEGVTAAIRRFYAQDRRISIYVFGDDFSRGSIQEVVAAIDAINRGQRPDQRLVRLHGVGFPVLFAQPGAGNNVARFAALMRRLAEDNNGSFVGLSSLR